MRVIRRDTSLTVCVSDLNIRFEGIENPGLRTYLLREFSCLIGQESEAPDVTIRVINEGFELSRSYVYIEKGIYASKHSLAQELCSRGNSIWILYNADTDIPSDVKVYIPYRFSTDNLSKLFHPSFLCKWEVSMLNFVHGPLLGLVQMHLVRRKATFFHASALSTDGKSGIALAGNGHSGKSTFVKWLAQTDLAFCVLAEDFCVINENKELMSYPKQMRIHLNPLQDVSYFKEYGQDDGLLNRLNALLFLAFKRWGIGPIRRMSFQQVFGDQRVIPKVKLEIILVINRSSMGASITTISKTEFVSYCTEMMMTEISNLAGVQRLMKALDKIHGRATSFDDLRVEFQRQFELIFKQTKCYFLNIPYYDDIQETKKEVLQIFNELPEGI